MAIQVRLDLTPSEFDLIREVLTDYAKDRLAESNEDTNNATERKDAEQAAARATFLLEKLQA